MYEFLDEEENKVIEKSPIVQLFYKIREWDKSWNKYFINGERPMNFTDFIDKLHKEFEVKNRVKND